ncbi:TetR/AcrR family transcriptional regulator [Pseudonocardia sp. CA-142604]|uniref:TetR/AcrR family transcriptional regulator n=1 Tax=Pseudonocardia sp. CA-142604 TaxID=3240024 RepID=UPI003D91DDAF
MLRAAEPRRRRTAEAARGNGRVPRGLGPSIGAPAAVIVPRSRTGASEEDTITTSGEREGRAGRRRSQESHQAILAATRELLEEVGYYRLTVEGVAARAGVGKTTVYRWWPSKSALVLEAVDAERADPPAPTGDVRADIRAAMEATREHLRPPLVTTLLALAGDLLQDASGEAGHADPFAAGRSTFEKMIEDAAARGDLPPDVDAGLLQDVYAGTLLYRVLCRRPTDDVVDKLLTLLLDGSTPRRSVESGSI